MTKRYELSIKILDDTYINELVVALMRQGYAPYYNPEEGGVVCIEVNDDELQELKD